MHTKKAEEMFCKNDHVKKEPETQVGDSGEEQPCLATTCCTTNIILINVDSKFLCVSVAVASVCLTGPSNNNDTEH